MWKLAAALSLAAFDIGKRSCRADERESTGEPAKRSVDRVFQAGRRKRSARQSAQEIPV